VLLGFTVSTCDEEHNSPAAAPPLTRHRPPNLLIAMSQPTDPPIAFSVPRPFVLRVTVGPEHIDPQGHASNVAFLDWMNRGAIAHSTVLGFDAAAYRRLGAMFVVRRHEIDYLRPARAEDELLCATWIATMDKATAERRHEIVRASDGVLIARGLNLWAFIDATTGRPRRIHDEVRAAFAAWDRLGAK